MHLPFQVVQVNLFDCVCPQLHITGLRVYAYIGQLQHNLNHKVAASHVLEAYYGPSPSFCLSEHLNYPFAIVARFVIGDVSVDDSAVVPVKQR